MIKNRIERKTFRDRSLSDYNKYLLEEKYYNESTHQVQRQQEEIIIPTPKQPTRTRIVRKKSSIAIRLEVMYIHIHVN